jgi:penicillin amidase
VSGDLSGARDRGRRSRLLGVGAVLLVAALAGVVSLEIHRDDRGIPHVEAATEGDALFGLGFVHAQDRLLQMLWLVRLARGRSAELLGPEGLPSDRRARTLDLGGLADAQFEHLDAVTRERVVAYAQGVNARIGRIREGLAEPPVGLRGAPDAIEDWRPSDSLAVLKLYSWGLSGSLDVSLVLSDLIEQLGGFGARRFFPRIPNLPDVPFRPPVTAGVHRPGGGDPLRAAARLRGRSIGSTAWVVGGARSESGAPILVADAHLETTAPSLFYVAHFRGGELNVAGATIPGIPAVWTGHNGDVAWASTHARAVTTDLYEEKLGEADEARYFDGADWRELGRRDETLEVRGAEDEELVVYSTHHGPLVSGLAEGEREPLALSWTGARIKGRSGIASLLEVARARDEAELLKALAGHEDPPLAVVYAAADGSAGMQVAGWIPSRTLASGLVPLHGRARWYDWRERIDFDSLPRQRLRSGAGWAIAADNSLASAEGGERVEWLWRSGTRARRIDALLRAATADGPVDLREMTALQNDIAMERASELIAIALSFAAAGESLGAEGREIAALLRAWDGRADATSVGAAAYHVFLEGLTRRLLEPAFGEELLQCYLALPQADPDQVVFEIVRDAAAGGLDGWSDPESVAAAVRESVREARFSLSFRLGANRGKWNWGRLHRLAFRPFRPGERLARGTEALGPFAYGGSAATVSAAEYDRADPFAVRVASTFRFAVDSAALDQALVTLAPGQSEHPGHSAFDDAMPRWREGRLHLLATAPLLVQESSRALLVLEPAP